MKNTNNLKLIGNINNILNAKTVFHSHRININCINC